MHVHQQLLSSIPSDREVKHVYSIRRKKQTDLAWAGNAHQRERQRLRCAVHVFRGLGWIKPNRGIPGWNQRRTDRRESGCVIPWEALTKKGVLLMAGVYGTGEGGEIVLPTVWASLGTIFEGAKLGQNTQPPTPDLWQQELAGKADGLDYTTDGELGLYAGKKLLSSVPIQGGGGGGVSDHRLLSHREDENQHPISSIIHLEETLDTIPTAMTAEELRKILMT